MTFADVILPVAVDQLFTYAVAESLVADCTIGKRVVVQFGRKKIYTGIIAVVHNTCPVGFAVKEIVSVLDDSPILGELHLSFWRWIADYYMCSLGEVSKAALPLAMKIESESTLIYNPDFDSDESLATGFTLSANESLMLDLLRNRKTVRLKELPDFIQSKNVASVVKSLVEKGAIRMDEQMTDSYRTRTEDFLVLNTNFCSQAAVNDLLAGLSRAPQQQRLLLNYLSRGTANLDDVMFEVEPVRRVDLLKAAHVTAGVLKALVDKQIFSIVRKAISRLETNVESTVLASQLNEYQLAALAEIENLFIEKDIVLLHGVTSSGKTEVYINLIQKYISRGQQVLYLLPEIALTSQIIDRLQAVFGQCAGVYHSKLSDSERVEIWQNVAGNLTGDKQPYSLILGVRSSVFLPFRSLGLVIVDEEHENTYKQFDPAPRYHARDSAVFLAHLSGAKTLLGSATPSVESFFNALSGKYGLVSLTHRFMDLQLPEFRVVDVVKERKRKKMKGHFSSELLLQIKQALDKGKQIILFRNRRGFSPYIECTECGWVPYCRQCNVSLTYHKHTNQLTCHYCGYSIHIPPRCPECGGSKVETRGFGTEKVEEEIALLFPDATVARLDVDTTRTKHGHKHIIRDFEQGRIDILIGTQMISKGLDFENVYLVGILNADQMLNFPDFRANERSFQLMAQVGGRAGRKNERGLVLIQANDPKHFVIRNVINNDFEANFKNELYFRHTFNYPPYYRIIDVSLRHADKNKVDVAATVLADFMRRIFAERVLGPEYPIVDKIQNYYIKKITLKIEREKSVAKAKELLKKQINRLLDGVSGKGIIVTVNVDPY